MSRRVRRKLASRGQEKADRLGVGENFILDERGVVDWTRLPDDTVIQLFSCLNYRDRASLSSTCRTWRSLGKSQCLWQALDLRAHNFDCDSAASLASRCGNLQKLRFRSAESAEAIIHLQSRDLREISGDYCQKITDATLAMIAARHEALESLQLGPDFCERISSSAIKAIAVCCPRLRKLRLSGIREVDGDAINALAKHCQNLMDVGFIDCLNVDEVALGNVASICFLSIAGTTNIEWNLALEHWGKLPNLMGLDVSRTDVIPSAVSRLFSSSQSLKIACALHCPALEQDATFVSNNNHKGKLLFAIFTDIFKELTTLFVDTPNKERNAFLEWRSLRTKERNLEDTMNWLEWVLSHSLLRIAESNPQGLDNFWLNHGAYLLLSLMQSTQEEVQERAATGLATFVVIDDENASIDGGRAEAVMRDGGIRLLLNLARSWREGLQCEAAKAIANLSVNANVAKAVAEEGGISILANLARSRNRLVAEEAAGGLWNLSVGEEHKAAIAEVGGIKALVDLIFKWSVNDSEGVLERAAGALANLAVDDKCSMEVATVGGVHALITLAQNCKAEGVQEQAARALANLAAHGDSNSNNATVGQEAGAFETLVQLTRSPHDGVRQEAAGALWNLSFDDRNREAITAAGGVEALVALAQSCSNASPSLQERAAGALWGLSVSEANSIAPPPQKMVEKDVAHNTEFEETSNETETQYLKVETEDLQTSIAAKDNFTQEYEDERAVLVRELAHLRNQLKSLNEDQSSVNTNENELVKDHQTNSDLASTASLHEMISDCCNFLKDAMHERSHTETRIRELDRLLHMKDQEIEVLNTKATEFSVLKDVALSHLNSEQEDSLRISKVQHETEQQVGEIANGILASLAMLAPQEELPDESVLGKMSHVQKQIDILVEKHKFFLSQIDQVRCCLAEVVPDLTVQDEMGIFVAAREKLIELKTAVNLSQSLSHLGDENRNLMEELDKHKAMLENANSEIVKLNVEAEQEKTRYANAKEKLSLAVTKGKALVQQRDALKQSLAEKTSELDKCLVELQEKSNALEAAEQTKELLVRSNELATSLQDAFSEKDNILQKCGEILSETYGEQLPLTDISENVRWLADERNSLKGIYLEFQKITEILSSFDFPETVQSSAMDARLSWLLESLYLAKEETGKLQEEMAASKEAANNKIDQLMTALLMETQEKNYLHGKLQEELAAAREAANSVIESLTTSLLVETQEKSYIQEELGNLTHDYEEIVQKEHYMSLEKDHFVNMLLVAAGIKLDDLELDCHQQSDTSVIIEKCLAKIKEENPSLGSSHIELECFQKIQSALYTRDLELKIYEPILAEEMLNKAELKHMSSELVVATKELNAVKEERNSLQKNLEQYEEKVALLKEKLSMAVKKGKGIVQERENLKRTLDDKNAEIERLRSELQQQLSIYRDCKDQIDKLSADVDLIPKLEADLDSIKDQMDQLERFLVESNSILQKVMETIDFVGLPAVSGCEGPVEKVKSLVGFFGECEKEKIEAEQELAMVKDEANTLLSKLLEAQTTIKSLQDSLSIAENSISQLQEEKKEQESSKILVEKELQRTIDALSITENSISQLQKDKNELESARILLEQELQKVVGEASTKTSQFAEVCASQKSLEDALSLAENNILVLKNEKEEALLSRDATQQELQKLKEEYSVDKGKLSEANETIRSLEDALGQARENISLVTEENSKTQIGITHLENEIRNLKEEVESKNSKLDDASITIKSLKDALLSAETKVSDLVNEKKNAEQEISDLNFKLSNCLQELAGSRGSIETKDLELSGHVKSLQLLLKDENLLYVAWRSFEKKFESLKEFNVHLKEIEDWFPEVHFKMLQGHSLLKDDSSMTTALLTGLDDVPDIEMANGELNALDDESIKFQISKTVKAFHHRNKILTERFEGYSTLIGDLITLVQKLITSLKQKTEDMDTDRQALDNKIDMMEGNLKVLFSACIDATRELNKGLQNDLLEASSNFYLEKLDDSMISDNVGDDDSARLPIFDHSNFEKAAEKLLVAARLSQNLRKQFQDANNEMVETTKDLQNKLKETSIACEGALEERELNRNKISQLENDLDNAQKLCSELRLKLEDHQAKEDRLKETEAELSALKSTVLSRAREAEDSLLSASQMKSLFEKVNKIEMPLGGAEVGNQKIHELDDLSKLFYVIDSFTGLQNQLDLLSHDKKELQSTLEKQNFEIEHLNEEMKKVKTYEKDCKKMKDELLELTRGLENVIQKLGGNNLVGAQKVAGVSGLLPILEKLVVALIFESENLKSGKEELGAQLLEMQKVVDELSSKVKSLEGSNQVEVIPGEINQKRDVFEVASLPAESEISEIQDMGSTSNNSASTSVPSAAHSRTLRKGSTDHLALTIDSGSERLLNDDEANEDKGHLFKSLVTTGLVPRQGRMLADRVDGIWVSSSRALMNRPQARIGLIVYSLLLHIWLLGTIL